MGTAVEAKELTPIQTAYVKWRLRGLNVPQAATAAGLASPHDNGHRLEEAVGVQLELKKNRERLEKRIGVTKETVAAGLMEAFEMARTMADPTAMVASMRELGKLLGHYAPEVKRLEKSLDKNEILKALEQMDDAELLRYRNSRLVEGTVLGKTEAPVPVVQEV